MRCYRIDAWLERDEPELKIVDRSSGAVAARWVGERLGWLFDRGYLEMEELVQPDHDRIEHLARWLLKGYCNKDIDREMAEMNQRECSYLDQYCFGEYLGTKKNVISIQG